MRVVKHPILGDLPQSKVVHIWFNGAPLEAIEGEPILAALAAHGIRQARKTVRRHEARWLFCGIGRCTDCVMVVDGRPNVRTCVEPVRDGMRVEVQIGLDEEAEDAS